MASMSPVTPRLERLVSLGLVQRQREPSDARASLISITPEGARALESVHAARRAILPQALEGIDPAQVGAMSA
jgi:DNA-binding MarR family transcriptional regulator